MNRPWMLVTALGLPCVSGAAVLAAGGDPAPFETASVRFERNATDDDAEVVFEAKAGDDGLASLTVVAPDGRTVVDATSPDASTLGVRSFVLESPEPRDVARVKAAYPEGTYSFTGAAFDGRRFAAKAVLSHVLPAPVSILHPADGDEDVATSALTLKWSTVPGAAAYTLEIEHEASNAQVKATLPASVTVFAVPEGFLQGGETYKVAIGTFADDGNLSVVEAEFDTAE